MMDRRLFLRNSALLAAGTATLDQLAVFDTIAPRKMFAAWPSMPSLYGTGVDDDTLAIEALLNGRPVFDQRTKQLATPLHLGKGRYRVTRNVDALHHAQVNGAAYFNTPETMSPKARQEIEALTGFAVRGDEEFASAWTSAITGSGINWKAREASGLILTDERVPVRLYSPEPDLRSAPLVSLHAPTKPVDRLISLHS